MRLKREKKLKGKGENKGKSEQKLSKVLKVFYYPHMRLKSHKKFSKTYFFQVFNFKRSERLNGVLKKTQNSYCYYKYGLSIFPSWCANILNVQVDPLLLLCMKNISLKFLFSFYFSLYLLVFFFFFICILFVS